MTNAEKYLKDGVSVEELARKIDQYCYDNETPDEDTGLSTEELVAMFFEEEIKPTLTEDERVILRNIPTKYWQKICRDNYGVLEIRGEYEEIDLHTDNISDFDEYNHLFQFIKERRRI